MVTKVAEHRDHIVVIDMTFAGSVRKDWFDIEARPGKDERMTVVHLNPAPGGPGLLIGMSLLDGDRCLRTDR